MPLYQACAVPKKHVSATHGTVVMTLSTAYPAEIVASQNPDPTGVVLTAISGPSEYVTALRGTEPWISAPRCVPSPRCDDSQRSVDHPTRAASWELPKPSPRFRRVDAGYLVSSALASSLMLSIASAAAVASAARLRVVVIAVSKVLSDRSHLITQ